MVCLVVIDRIASPQEEIRIISNHGLKNVSIFTRVETRSKNNLGQSLLFHAIDLFRMKFPYYEYEEMSKY